MLVAAIARGSRYLLSGNTIQWVSRRGSHNARVANMTQMAPTNARFYSGISDKKRLTMWKQIWKIGAFDNEGPACPGQVVDLEDGTRVLIIVDGARPGTVVSVVGSTCPHVGAPLVSGVLHENHLLCPWHGACFNVHTGDIEEGPSIHNIPVYKHRIREGHVEIEINSETKAPVVLPRKVRAGGSEEVNKVVVIGSGAGGHAAVSVLVEQGFKGSITLISEEHALPYDRPTLSKFMSKPLDSILLSPPSFYNDKVKLMLGCTATSIRAAEKSVVLQNGITVPYDKLIVATGGTPFKLRIPGSDLGHIYTLRSAADANAIAARAETSKKIIIIGAGFIGLEAASYFQRNTDAECITILNRDPAPPLANVFGQEIGSCVQMLHESNGIKFVFNCGISQFLPGSDPKSIGKVVTDKGDFEADLVLVGIGVALNTSLLKGTVEMTERIGEVQVNHFMQTTNSDIYAVGDIARFPLWSNTGKARSEHWAVAQNQGRTAARHILGLLQPFKSVPFFWSVMFGSGIRFAGYTMKYDRVIVDGDLSQRKFLAFFVVGDSVAAVASLGRDPMVAASIELFRTNRMPTVKELESDLSSRNLKSRLAQMS